jgi:hypothetical protein
MDTFWKPESRPTSWLVVWVPAMELKTGRAGDPDTGVGQLARINCGY